MGQDTTRQEKKKKTEISIFKTQMKGFLSLICHSSCRKSHTVNNKIVDKFINWDYYIKDQTWQTCLVGPLNVQLKNIFIYKTSLIRGKPRKAAMLDNFNTNPAIFFFRP